MNTWEKDERLKQAEILIQRAIEIMTLEQISEWDGVRAWQESGDVLHCGLDVGFEMVREFHWKFGYPAPDVPCRCAPVRKRKREQLILDALSEYCEAQDIVDEVNAIVYLMYFALSTLVEMGIKPQRHFEVIHDANMRGVAHDDEILKLDKQ
jgi:predicted HAD superfamily Cof-like phosphohydrolase